jgi:hypothetical protein
MCLRYGQLHALRSFSREVGPSTHLLCRAVERRNGYWEVKCAVRGRRRKENRGAGAAKLGTPAEEQGAGED